MQQFARLHSDLFRARTEQLPERMTNEDGKPTAADKADKGKGKATDNKLPDGDGKTDGGKVGQDGKLTNGKKGDEPQEGMISGQAMSGQC